MSSLQMRTTSSSEVHLQVSRSIKAPILGFPYDLEAFGKEMKQDIKRMGPDWSIYEDCEMRVFYETRFAYYRKVFAAIKRYAGYGYSDLQIYYASIRGVPMPTTAHMPQM